MIEADKRKAIFLLHQEGMPRSRFVDLQSVDQRVLEFYSIEK
jgi:hypothetical protein